MQHPSPVISPIYAYQPVQEKWELLACTLNARPQCKQAIYILRRTVLQSSASAEPLLRYHHPPPANRTLSPLSRFISGHCPWVSPPGRRGDASPQSEQISERDIPWNCIFTFFWAHTNVSYLPIFLKFSGWNPRRNQHSEVGGSGAPDSAPPLPV